MKTCKFRECSREHGASMSSTCRAWAAREYIKKVSLWTEAVGHLRWASRRSWSASKVSPHHWSGAYGNLATMVAWKTVYWASVDTPLYSRVCIANNDSALDNCLCATPLRVSCQFSCPVPLFLHSWDGQLIMIISSSHLEFQNTS